MYRLYLKYLRYRIKQCKTIDDYLKIIKNIDYFHKNVNSDKLCDIIIQCLELSPLTEEELQNISILQQQYENENGLYNYITIILWTCIIYYIQQSNIDNSNSANIDNSNTAIVVSSWRNSYEFNLIHIVNLLYKLKSVITFNKL